MYDYDGLTRIGQETLPPAVSTLSGGGGGSRGMVFPHSPLFDGQKGARLFAALSHDGNHKGGPHADSWQALPGLSVGGNSALSALPDFAAFAKPLANLSVAQSGGGGDYTFLCSGALGNMFGLETVSGGQISGSYRNYDPQGNLSRQSGSNGSTQYQAQNAQTSMGNRAEGPGGSSPPLYATNFGTPSGNDDDDFPIDSSGKTHLYDGFWDKVHQLGKDMQAIGNAFASGNYLCNLFTAATGQDASGNCVSKFDRIMAAMSTATPFAGIIQEERAGAGFFAAWDKRKEAIHKSMERVQAGIKEQKLSEAKGLVNRGGIPPCGMTADAIQMHMLQEGQEGTKFMMEVRGGGNISHKVHGDGWGHHEFMRYGDQILDSTNYRNGPEAYGNWQKNFNFPGDFEKHFHIYPAPISQPVP